MTVALGIVCSDGIVVASDSMGSAERIATSVPKVHIRERFPLAWVHAGSTYIYEEAEAALDDLEASWPDRVPEHWTQPSIRGIRRDLAEYVGSAVKAGYKQVVEIPGHKISDPATEFLFLGWGEKGPFFLHLHADTTVTDQLGDKMAAIGFGGQLAAVARSIMEHYMEDEFSVRDGMMIAYRAISTVVQVSTWGVALPVQMAVVEPVGARLLTQSEIEQVALTVDRWKLLERDSLRELLRGQVQRSADVLPSLDAEADVQIGRADVDSQ